MAACGELDSSAPRKVGDSQKRASPTGHLRSGQSRRQQCRAHVTDMSSLKARLRKASSGTGEIHEVFESCEFEPGAPAFTKLIVLFGRSGLWMHSVEIFKEMCAPKFRARGIAPNSYTYTALISVLVGAKKWQEALKIFEAMLKKTAKETQAELESESSCAPSYRTFEKLITGCEEAGRCKPQLESYYTAKMVQLFQQMCAWGIVPSKVTLVAVLDASVKYGNWDIASYARQELHFLESQVRSMVFDRHMMCWMAMPGPEDWMGNKFRAPVPWC